MTDDDAYEAHRDRARASDLGRRRSSNGDAERNQLRTWIEKLESDWIQEIYLRLWPF